MVGNLNVNNMKIVKMKVILYEIQKEPLKRLKLYISNTMVLNDGICILIMKI